MPPKGTSGGSRVALARTRASVSLPAPHRHPTLHLKNKEGRWRVHMNCSRQRGTRESWTFGVNLDGPNSADALKPRPQRMIDNQVSRIAQSVRYVKWGWAGASRPACPKPAPIVAYPDGTPAPLHTVRQAARQSHRFIIAGWGGGGRNDM